MKTFQTVAKVATLVATAMTVRVGAYYQQQQQPTPHFVLPADTAETDMFNMSRGVRYDQLNELSTRNASLLHSLTGVSMGLSELTNNTNSSTFRQPGSQFEPVSSNEPSMVYTNEASVIFISFSLFALAYCLLRCVMPFLALEKSAEAMVSLQIVRGMTELFCAVLWTAYSPRFWGGFLGWIPFEKRTPAEIQMARFTILIVAAFYAFELSLRPSFSLPTAIHHSVAVVLTLVDRLMIMPPLVDHVLFVELAFGVLVFPRGIMLAGRHLTICQGAGFRKLWVLAGVWDILLWCFVQMQLKALFTADQTLLTPSWASLWIGLVALAAAQLAGALISFRVATKPPSMVAHIYRAQSVLQQNSIEPTPLTKAPWLNVGKHQVFLKREDLQVTGSFKVRGAFNRMASLSHAQRKRGVIACSAGNHGCAVAYSAYKLGIDALVVLPNSTPQPLLKRLDKLNPSAQVLLFGDTMEASLSFTKSLAKATRRVFVHPFNDAEIVAGQGTVGLELARQLRNKDVDVVFCPVGGGGLLAGVAAAVHSWKPSCRVVGVVMEGSTGMTDSLAAGYPKVGQVDLFARGTAISQPGAIPFAIAKHHLHGMITVTREEVTRAAAQFFQKTHCALEPAGAQAMAGAAAYISSIQFAKPQKMVAIVSGGNAALADDDFLCSICRS